MKKNILLLSLLSSSLFASGHHFDAMVFSANIFTFFVLVMLFVVFAKKPLKNFFITRKDLLKSKLEKSELAKNKLEKRLIAMRDKYSNLEEEKDTIRKNSLLNIEEKIKDLDTENHKILEKMDNDLELQENNIVKNTIDNLQKEISYEAISVAEEKIKKLLEEDKLLEVRLLKQFKISKG